MTIRVAVSTAVLLVAHASSCADDPKPATDAKRIQGTWVVTEMQHAGRDATKEEKEFFKKGGYTITITAEKMTHSPDKSEVRYRLDPTKKPAVLEVLEDGKVVARGIYELKGDDLKICLGRRVKGDEEPQPPADFDVKKADPGTSPTLLVLRREAEKPADKK